MSSDKSIVMKAFLNQFTEFVVDVQSVFPDNPDIDSAKTALMLMRPPGVRGSADENCCKRVCSTETSSKPELQPWPKKGVIAWLASPRMQTLSL